MSVELAFYLCVDVAPKRDEEPDDVEVSGADGVVKGRDALVVGRRRVGHQPRRALHKVELALQRSVEEQRQRVEANVPAKGIACL